jgi:hypothetical protein
MIQIKLQAAPSGQPGYGELVVSGWSHGAEACELCVLRNQDKRYLGNAEDWDNREVWHQLGNLREGSGCLLGDVGPWLVDALTRDQRYMLTLRNAQGNDNGVLRIVGTLLSSKAAGNSRFDEKKVDHATMPAPKDEVMAKPPSEPGPQPEPEPAHDPVAEPPAKKKSRGPLLPIIGLLLALAAGVLFWMFGMKSDEVRPMSKPPETPAVPAIDAPPAVPAADAPVCGAAALGGTADDLTFIQSCIKSQPTTRQVLEAIAAAKEAGRCNVMQRLYAHKAQSGDAAVAYAYAREYDPQHYAGGGCIEAADAETAAYWYEIAVEQDPQNEDAEQRLKEVRK